MPRIIKQESTKKQKAFVYSIGTLVSFLMVILLILLLGKSLSETFQIFGKIFVGMKMLKNVFNIAIPLTIAAFGLAVCYKMKFYNIGGEGQIIAGAIASCYVARAMENQNKILTLTIMFIVAIVAGGLFAMITSLLKIYFNANEVIVTLMFNYIALVFARILVSNYWKEGEFVVVRPITDNARLSNLKLSSMLFIFLIIMAIYNTYKYIKQNKKFKNKIIGENKDKKYIIKLAIITSIIVLGLISVFFVVPSRTKVNSGLFLLLIIFIAVDIFLNKTKKGFEIAVIGESLDTAVYAGMSIKKTTILVTFISGAILGMTGFIKLAGVNHQFSSGITSGIGFTAVIIAWLADLKNGRILIVGFAYAFLFQGIKFVESSGVNTSAADIILAIILFTALTCEFFNRYKIVGGTKNA